MTKKFILAYLLIIIFLNSNSYGEDNRYFEFDKGIVALMYHRFDENKYPSTNIQMDIFKKQISIIENLDSELKQETCIVFAGSYSEKYSFLSQSGF